MTAAAEAPAGQPKKLGRTGKGMTYGLLVPHFGAAASAERILRTGPLVEQAGFDAVWVRDHLLWEPHAMEGDDRTFVEALTVLAAIGARTQRIQLGTAVLIPIRWPLKLAQDLASLSYLTGGRVVAGLGLGSGQAELGAAGFQRPQRKQIFVETTEILRRVWGGQDVSYEGKFFRFSGVNIEPKPAGELPLWYGGTSEASVRNAVNHCDGWIPGRIPVTTLKARLDLLSGLENERGTQIRKGIIPLVTVARNRQEARSKIDVQALAGSSEASKSWVMPPGGFNTIGDLLGIVVAGEPKEVVDQIADIAEHGIDHFVFDLRLQHDAFEEAVGLIAGEVLPALRTAGI